jgi:adenine phosphoribosyltransferase
MKLFDRFGLRLEGAFASVSDFPIPGFVFPDITPLLEREPEIYRAVIDEFISKLSPNPPDFLVCIDSFGYLFGAPIAYELGSRIVLARRTGKLPRESTCAKYSMVYDAGREICLHTDVLQPGARVVVIDDFLATGGTVGAVITLLHSMGVMIQSTEFVVELPECRGRAALQRHGVPIHALIRLRLEKEGVWHVEPD